MPQTTTHQRKELKMETCERLKGRLRQPIIEYVKKGKKLPKFFSLTPNEKYEFFGKNFRDLSNYDQMEIIMSIENIHQPQRKKMAVMVAGALAENLAQVVVGFSVCHSQLDLFDHTNQGPIKKVPGLGVNIAMSNAIKWKSKKFIVPPDQDYDNDAGLDDFNDYLFIPSTMMKYESNLLFFIDRVKRYYKGKVLPAWCYHMEKVANAWTFVECKHSTEDYSKDECTL